MPTEPPAHPPRGRRSDAARNRRALLAVAGRLIASQGIAVPLDEIVREAGLSSGTLYRNFTSRTALIRALYDQIVERTDALVDRVVAQPSGWDAIVTYLDGILGIADDHPETQAVFAYMRRHDPTYRTGDQWIEPTQRTVERARAEGTLRADVTATDLAYVPHLLVPLVRWPEPQRGILLSRMRALLLDALRAPDVDWDPMPLQPLSVAELRALSTIEPAPPDPPPQD